MKAKCNSHPIPLHQFVVVGKIGDRKEYVCHFELLITGVPNPWAAAHYRAVTGLELGHLNGGLASVYTALLA